jgi:hypothetical protein
MVKIHQHPSETTLSNRPAMHLKSAGIGRNIQGALRLVLDGTNAFRCG